MPFKRFLTVLAALWMVLAFCAIAQAAPGDLDPTFGTGGTDVVTFGSGQGAAQAVAEQPDGNIVVAGWVYTGTRYEIALARLDPGGALDTSFGTGGEVLTPFGLSSQAFGEALQPDGKIVLAGWEHNPNTGGFDFAVLRYTTKGQLDATFSGDGMAHVDFGSRQDFATAVALQQDGKIVVAGYSADNQSNQLFAVARLKANGRLDTTFGGGLGRVVTDFSSSYNSAQAVAIQSDGRILVAGYAAEKDFDFAVARFDSSGALDPTFGTGGKVVTNVNPFSPSSDLAYGMALQGNGRILVVGSSNSGPGAQFAVVRYNTDGSLDTSFRGGRVLTRFGDNKDTAFAVAVQSSKKIVVLGQAKDEFALARYTPKGNLDGTFGSGGKVLTNFGTGALAVAIQSDQRILAAGGTETAFGLARYLNS
jgi:uncharacterized delta-60 repeat protein